MGFCGRRVGRWSEGESEFNMVWFFGWFFYVVGEGMIKRRGRVLYGYLWEFFDFFDLFYLFILNEKVRPKIVTL